MFEEVPVTGGVVRGAREGSTVVWRGIPYAAPPVGEFRFRRPQPVVPWAGVRDALDFGKVATQAYKGQFKGVGPGVPSGEDCLTINVIAPAADPDADAEPRAQTAPTATDTAPAGRATPAAELRPVMVFIHGGGYAAGSSRDFSGQGDGFVRTGQVVYVSFNYRLGALGYLDLSRYSSEARPIDSNLGLRDQVAALEWVQQNIRSFGGDPSNVTLFGESAGGNAVTTLMATPAAAGLFARAIAQSSPPSSVYPKALAQTWGEEFVSIVRAQFHPELPATGPIGPIQAAHLLDATSAADLVTASLALQLHVPNEFPGTFCLAPVVDGDFLPEHPLAAFREGRAHRVPLIIGSNNREGTLFRGKIDILPRSPRRIRAMFQRAPRAARTLMQHAYPGLPSRRSAADFGGDYAFWYPSTKVADSHSRYAPVFAYRFDVAPRLLRMVGLDATHGVEMYALFDQADVSLGRVMTALGGREPFSAAGERMRENWLRFANQRELAGTWPAYTEQHRLTNIIGETDHIESDPRRQRRLAWDAFLPFDEPEPLPASVDYYRAEPVPASVAAPPSDAAAAASEASASAAAGAPASASAVP
ncbi:carboxylesterase/lipase family protein [Subtercola lobariae]|uniref:Carboxylic ester hydrolase n=1 Tax=Subtercola lobariae TaxID=1588641 RepID=A0A917B2T4_9MICO|nr:carboxylesterase/lipase family protein [Subtercola lobariae]GGF16315.1 carboxylic ester hydrolase [Subtercola lobariae]